MYLLKQEGYGIGDDDSSVAFDGCRQLLWHDASSEKVDVPRWRPGDRVGSVLDLDRKIVAFFHNGELAVVFDRLFSRDRRRDQRGFFAAASFMSFQQCRFNFGASEPKYPIREWPPGKRADARNVAKMFNDYGTLSQKEKVILPRYNTGLHV